MNLDVFVVCDRIENANGKVSLFGIYESILTTSIPSVHPTLSLFARLRLSRNDGQQHFYSFKIFYPNGKLMMDTNEVPSVNLSSIDEETYITGIPMTLDNVKFPVQGRYSLCFFVDNNKFGEIPLFIR